MAQTGRPPKKTVKTAAAKTRKPTKTAAAKTSKAKKTKAVAEPEVQAVVAAPQRSIVTRTNILIAAGVVVVVAALVFAGIVYKQSRDDVDRLADPDKAARQDAKELTDKISKVAIIPTDETPTLATVSDASKLKNQVFFRNAKNGDKVLIFSKAGRAVLYRPSVQKIVEIAPLSSTNAAGQ